jgi:hypothetical protein
MVPNWTGSKYGSGGQIYGHGLRACFLYAVSRPRSSIPVFVLELTDNVHYGKPAKDFIKLSRGR